jgi:hypothetical protein
MRRKPLPTVRKIEAKHLKVGCTFTHGKTPKSVVEIDHDSPGMRVRVEPGLQWIHFPLSEVLSIRVSV